MPSVTDTLQAMESMAKRAAVRDLQDMLDTLVALRTHPVLQDRARADSLLLQLDRLLGRGSDVPQSHAAVPPLTLKLRLQALGGDREGPYSVRFFDDKKGDVAYGTTRESFEAAVQLVRFRLPVDQDYHIAATWSQRAGKMAVSTPRGKVLARIELCKVDTGLAGRSLDLSHGTVSAA